MGRRILLLFPQLNNLVFFGVYEPLVLEIFSAIAKEEGCETELVDLRIEPDGCERLARKGYVPDLIAMTTHGFPEVPIVNGIARRCKELWPAAALVIGGGQATVSPELFDQAAIDLIVRGPGERLWRELCRTGVEVGPCRITQDPHPPKIYSYPVPDRKITAKYRHRYVTNIPHHSGRRWGKGGRTAFTLLTQGCPFRCSFCVIWRANLGMFRKRPIPEIIADLQSIEEDYVYLGDDNTFADPKFANALADAIRGAGIRKELSSYCRADHICDHPELLKKWHDIGLRYLVVGVEAVTSDMLVRFNKKTETDQNTRALAVLKEIGIFAIPHILVSPDMKAGDFDEIYTFIEQNEFEYPVVIPLTPLPGTDDHRRYNAEKRLLTTDLRFYTFMYNVIRPLHMSPRQYDAAYDRLVFRMWSWKRYLRGKCGRTSFAAFLQWWVLVRLLVLQLRWKRRAIYRDADSGSADSSSVFTADTNLVAARPSHTP
jgi:magnesium-protoporphyrin IX monomethyl ester (oxidative) cyclase